jgi:hypothetical protein
MKTKSIIPFAMLLLLALNSYATDAKAGDKVTIQKAVNEDLYITAGTVTINAPIYGDLVVAGGTVTINDSVAFDLIVTGGEIFINGYVGDDIRSAGGRIHISGGVGGDVVVGGGNIIIEKQALINGSLIAGGGDITLDGTVIGDTKVGFGKLTFNGVVRKDFLGRGQELNMNGQVFGLTKFGAGNIEIGEDAEFHGDVKYWSKSGSVDFKESIKEGGASIDPSLKIETGRWEYLGFVSFLALLAYLGAAFVMIFLLQYLCGFIFSKAAHTALAESFKSLGVGVLFVVAMPVAIVLCFVTLIGIPLGIIFLFSYITLFMLATVVTSLVISHWINNVYYEGKWKYRKLSLMAFLIFVGLKLFSLTPFIGFAVTALMVCMAWGAILLNVQWKKNREALVGAPMI